MHRPTVFSAMRAWMCAQSANVRHFKHLLWQYQYPPISSGKKHFYFRLHFYCVYFRGPTSLQCATMWQSYPEKLVGPASFVVLTWWQTLYVRTRKGWNYANCLLIAKLVSFKGNCFKAIEESEFSHECNSQADKHTGWETRRKNLINRYACKAEQSITI